MQQILEVATKISTPLMLGGLIVIALLIVFRTIIVPNFIPQVNQGQGATILKIIIIGFFVLALVATVLGYYAYTHPVEVVPDSYRTKLPPGLTFEQAAILIARTDGRGYSVEFVNCGPETRNTVIQGVQIGGKDGAGAIANLRLNVEGSNQLDYAVKTIMETQRYEITCKK